jgi:hypothetical protein
MKNKIEDILEDYMRSKTTSKTTKKYKSIGGVLLDWLSSNRPITPPRTPPRSPRTPPSRPRTPPSRPRTPLRRSSTNTKYIPNTQSISKASSKSLKYKLKYHKP